MSGERTHERLTCRLVDHRVKVIDEHVGELASGVAEPHDSPIIISFDSFDRIRQGQYAAVVSFHPDGLIVAGPVHEIAIAGFLQKIGGDLAVRHPRAHPADRTLPLVALGGLRRRPNELGFGLFVKISLSLGVGETVSKDFVAALVQLLRDLRRVLVDGRIHLVRVGLV